VNWIGGAFFISSSKSFLIAISWGCTMEPWESFRTLVPLIFAILGMIGNAIWETYFAKKPFMGRNLFHCRDAFLQPIPERRRKDSWFVLPSLG
jgi:hypothetical protein